MWSLTLEKHPVLSSPFVGWRRAMKSLLAEMTWGKWHRHCEVQLGCYWPSVDSSEEAPPLPHHPWVMKPQNTKLRMRGNCCICPLFLRFLCFTAASAGDWVKSHFVKDKCLVSTPWRTHGLWKYFWVSSAFYSGDFYLFVIPGTAIPSPWFWGSFVPSMKQ